MIFYLLVNYFSTDKRLEILSLLIIAGATLFSIGGMIGFYIVEGHPLSERMGFTFRHMQTTYLGFITVFAAILTVRSFHHYNYFTYKVLFGICFLINVLVTILTQCRGFLISLAVMMIILCFDNKKNAILIIITLLLLLAVPGSMDRARQMGFTEDIRSKMYRLSLEIIKDYPIAGIGFGMETYSNKKLISLDKYNKRLPLEHQQKTLIVETPHGTFFDIAVRTGLVGFILFFYILLTPIWLLWKILRRHKDDRFRSWAIYLLAGLITFSIESAFYDATYGERAIYFYTILAMITILWNLSRKTTQSTARPEK
jgi:O-antigen ligase